MDFCEEAVSCEAAVAPKLTGESELAHMAEIFRCFADPTRLKIINALLLKELCVCDFTKFLRMTQPAVSHHLKQLRQLRLVKSRRAGKAVFYQLDDDHVRLLFDLCRTHVNEPGEKEVRA